MSAEELWVTPNMATTDLLNRGYNIDDFDAIMSSHEEVALSRIAKSVTLHDLIELVRLIRYEETRQQG